MKWKILLKNPEDIVKTLSEIRNVDLNPKFPELKLDLTKAKKIISEAIKNEEKIVVYGDYDVDGICATAIMWEALHSLGAKVMPFIPQREKEGYGLSKEGIDQIDAKLIIVVDSGITAHEAVEYAHSKKIKIIIIDHHEKPKKLPKAEVIIHTTELCSAGIAYFVTSVILANDDGQLLELAAMATVADMVPLTGVNRSIVKHGLRSLNETKRPGLKALYEAAGIKQVGVYEIGFMIGPRLNAAGRIDSALTALRLLCTHDRDKAKKWAEELNKINKERQEMVVLQMSDIRCQTSDKIIFIEHEKYHQGIIGLIAGKLMEKYYLPSIVISRGETVSKASARSITGFNIIEAIREFESLLIDAGGHPAAAGFTIKTSEISNFKLLISKYADEKITDDLLEKTLKIDCELDWKNINRDFYNELARLEPYGMGNPEPVFCSEAIIQNIRTVGDGKHLKLTLCRHSGKAEGRVQNQNTEIDAIFFNGGYLFPQLKTGQKIKLAYSLDLNTFNSKTNLQLKIKDIIAPMP